MNAPHTLLKILNDLCSIQARAPYSFIVNDYRCTSCLNELNLGNKPVKAYSGFRKTKPKGGVVPDVFSDPKFQSSLF